MNLHKEEEELLDDGLVDGGQGANEGEVGRDALPLVEGHEAAELVLHRLGEERVGQVAQVLLEDGGAVGRLDLHGLVLVEIDEITTT